MLDPETRRKARELGVPGLVDIMETLTEDRSYDGVTVGEAMQLLVDHVWQEAEARKVAGLIKNARFRLPQADIADIRYEGRKIDRSQVLRLGTAKFVESATDVIIQGATGSGKTFAGCALGKQACKHRIRTLYIRMPDLFAYRAERVQAGWSQKKVLNHFANYRLLVVDEVGMGSVGDEDVHFLFELVERRYDCSSTIWCSQHEPSAWHARFGGGAHAEAILDRIVHNSETIDLGDANMRSRAHS